MGTAKTKKMFGSLGAVCSAIRVLNIPYFLKSGFEEWGSGCQLQRTHRRFQKGLFTHALRGFAVEDILVLGGLWRVANEI